MAALTGTARAISPRGVAAAAALWVSLHALMALVYAPEFDPPAPSLAVLALVLGASAWIARPLLGAAPGLPSAEAWALAAVPVIASATVTTTLLPTSLPGYANWWPGAVGPLLAGLVMRRHRIAGVGSAGLACAVMVVVVMARFPDAGRAPVVAVALVVPPVLWTSAALGVRWLLDRAEGSVQTYSASEASSVRRSATATAGERARAERERRLAEDVVPVLAAVARGLLPGDDPGLRTRLSRLERSLRDDIRGRRLLDARVRQEVVRARDSGVRVMLTDDREEALPDGEAELARQCVLAALSVLRRGTLSARLPAHEAGLLTLVVQSSPAAVAAAAAGVLAVAGRRAVTDADGEDLFVQVLSPSGPSLAAE